MALGKKTGGRQKGSVNRVTREVREVLRQAAEALAPDIGGWIREVAEGAKAQDGDWYRRPDPKGAAELALSVAEFSAPKLARVEHQGELRQTFQVVFANTKAPGPAKE